MAADDNRVLAGVAAGVVLGAVAYFVFTPHGRRTLDNLDALVDEVPEALEKVRRGLQRADGIVREARTVLDELRTILKPEAPTAPGPG